MGFGVSGASAIIFLGLLIGAVTMYSAVDVTAERLDEAHDDDQERLLDQRNTDIEITAAAYNATLTELTVTVDNKGTTMLSVNETTLLVDNEHRSLVNATVDQDPDTDLWAPGQTLTVTVTADAPSRVKVVTGNGVAGARDVNGGG
jgi:flagellar protein FlaF